MGVILSATAPIFVLIAIGFLAIRTRVLSRDQFVGLGALVMRLALPALILQTFAQRPLREIVDARYLLVYGAGCLAVQVGAFLLCRFALRLPTAESAVRALGMSAGNSGYVGFPIALQLVGPSAGIGLALCMLVENVLVIPLALALGEAGIAGGGSLRSVILATAKRLVRMPLLIAIVIGFAISALELRFPEPLARTLALLAGASAPLALLAIGGSLDGLRFSRVAGPALGIVAGKLLLLPLATVAILQVVAVPDPDLRKALIVYSASPMLSIYPIMAARFGFGELAAAALLGATIASFGTISAILWLIG